MTQVILSQLKFIKKTGSPLLSLQKIHGPGHRIQATQESSVLETGYKNRNANAP